VGSVLNKIAVKHIQIHNHRFIICINKAVDAFSSTITNQTMMIHSTSSSKRIGESVRLLELLVEAPDVETEIELIEVTNAFFSELSPTDCRFLCDNGAATLVLKCLTRCRQSSDDRSTALKCNLLSSLLFNAAEVASPFFYDSGAELLSLLSVLLDKQKGMLSQKALLAFLYQLREIKVSFLFIKNGHVLIGLLLNFMQCNDDRAECAAMLLSAWTRDRGNGMYVAKLPKAAENLIHCALVTKDYVVRFHVAQILHNLAAEKRNRKKLVQTGGFLESLELFLGVSHTPTKLLAIKTVEIVVSDNKFKSLICYHNKGAIAKLMVSNLKSLDVRVDSAKVIFRLIQRRTAGALINRCAEIVPRLIRIASNASTEDEVATVAAYSLMRLARYIAVGHNAYHKMMEVLVCLSNSFNASIRLWAALALSEHSKNQFSAFTLARLPFAIKALVTLANDSEKSTRILVIQTMLRIASNLASMKRLIYNPELIEAVVNHATAEIQQSTVARETIELLLTFTGMTSAHPRLAKQYGLVESLACFGVRQDAGEKLRRRSLHAVSLLAIYL
jgi:hypothetical protein